MHIRNTANTKGEAAMYNNEKLEEELCVMAVHEDGMHVLLEDGSSWDIQPGPSTKVVLWTPSQRVTIERVDEGGGYMLTNLDTSSPDRVPATPGSWDPDEREIL
jgi:hypothetical protein